MIFEESYTLHNGVAIPKLALGTWFIDDDKAAEAVQAAVNIGYRHIDTAQAYGNERGVGEGIRTCGIDRKDIFVTYGNASAYATILTVTSILSLLLFYKVTGRRDVSV